MDNAEGDSESGEIDQSTEDIVCGTCDAEEDEGPHILVRKAGQSQKVSGFCFIFIFEVSELVSKKCSGCSQNLKSEMHWWLRLPRSRLEVCDIQRQPSWVVC